MKCGIPEEWLCPFSDAALALYFYIIAETGILASRTRMSLHRDGKFLRMLPPISVPVICLCCAAVEAAVLSCLAGALMVIHNLLYFSDHLLFFLGHFLFLFTNLNHMSFIVVAHL